MVAPMERSRFFPPMAIQMINVGEETGELVFIEVIGDAREKLLNYRLPKGVGIAGWAVAHRRARLVANPGLVAAHIFAGRLTVMLSSR